MQDDKLEDDDVDKDDRNGDDDVKDDNVEEGDKTDNVDVAEDELGADDVEDDKVKGEEDDTVENEDVMLSRRETMLKMMILRKRMATPKTGTRTSRKPAKSKYTWTLKKGHLAREFTSKMPQAKIADLTLRKPTKLKCSHFLRKFTQNSADQEGDPHVIGPRNRNALGISSEPSLPENFQGKCWRPRLRPTLCTCLDNRNALGRAFLKNNFAQQFTSNMPETKTADQTLRKPKLRD